MCEALTHQDKAANWVRLDCECPCDSTRETKACLTCGQEFVDAKVDDLWVKVLGHGRLDFCPVCLRKAFFASPGKGNMAKKKVLAFIRELAQVLGHAPNSLDLYPQEMADMSDQERLTLLQLLLGSKPSYKRVQ